MRVRGWKDLLLVTEGVRHCALLSVAESDLLDLILTLESKGVKYTFSARKLVNRRQVSLGSYSYQRTAISLDSPEEGDILVYVCKADTNLSAAKNADSERNDTLIGELLDYPSCCITYFCKRFDRYHFNNSIQKMIESYLKEKGPKTYPFVMNIFTRFYNQSILSHYPCKLDCEKSIKLGFEYLSSLKSTDPKIARQLEEQAKCMVAISPESGLWAFRWNPLEKSVNQSLATVVNWDVDQDIDSPMRIERVLVKPVSGGINIIDEDGTEKFLESYILNFQ